VNRLIHQSVVSGLGVGEMGLFGDVAGVRCRFLHINIISKMRYGDGKEAFICYELSLIDHRWSQHR